MRKKRAHKHAEEREHEFKKATRLPRQTALDTGDVSESTSLIVQPVAEVRGLHPLKYLLLLAVSASLVFLVLRRQHSPMELPLLLE